MEVDNTIVLRFASMPVLGGRLSLLRNQDWDGYRNGEWCLSAFFVMHMMIRVNGIAGMLTRDPFGGHRPMREGSIRARDGMCYFLIMIMKGIHQLANGDMDIGVDYTLDEMDHPYCTLGRRRRRPLVFVRDYGGLLRGRSDAAGLVALGGMSATGLWNGMWTLLTVFVFWAVVAPPRGVEVSDYLSQN